MKIVLIGFMGAGKTSVAKSLAKNLGLKVIDMDSLALNRSGRNNINEIFHEDGEAKFRKIEFEVAKDISAKDDVVISTGGGVVLNNDIMDYLKNNGCVVYLKSAFGNITKRIRLKKIRPPLFQNVESARKLFDLREPLYERYADITIETDGKNIDAVSKEIVNSLK